MSGENWTPGPWSISLGPQGAIPAATITSGAMASVYSITDDEREYQKALAIAPNCARLADARLIAAAPDMYEALETVLDDYEEAAEEWVDDASYNAMVRIRYAKAALAKARGEGQ